MLQELVAETGASAWAIGSLVFFVIAWVAVVVWMVGKRPEELDAHARLPLEGDGNPGAATQDSGIGSQDSVTPDSQQ